MTGWLPDFVYRDGNFESGVALFVDEAGQIAHFSSQPEDISQARRLPNRVMLPGLINAHSHSFQRAIRGRTETRRSGARDTFWTWREAMYQAANRLSPEDIYAVARMAFLEMLLSGITTVREFHYLHRAPDGSPYDEPNLLALQVIGAAEEVGLRIALLRSAYVRAGWGRPMNPAQRRFITPAPDTFMRDTEALRRFACVGIAPHSMRAVPLEYLLEITRYARMKQLPVDMHIAEQPAEIEECLAGHGRRPLELLDGEGVLDSSFTAVHAIHITDREIQALGRAGAWVCACPTTERNLGDGAVPADRLTEAGVRICLGSDSNVQIDLLEDARSLEYHLRMNRLERCILHPRLLLENAVGKLEAGHPADFFTLDLNDPSIGGAAGNESLIGNIVFCAERTAIREVCVGGKAVVQDGRHPLHQTILEAFAQVQRRIWA